MSKRYSRSKEGRIFKCYKPVTNWSDLNEVLILHQKGLLKKLPNVIRHQCDANTGTILYCNRSLVMLYLWLSSTTGAETNWLFTFREATSSRGTVKSQGVVVGFTKRQ